MLIRQLFDTDTWTYTCLVTDLEAEQAAIIDPVDSQIDRDLRQLEELGCELKYSLDTHVHALMDELKLPRPKFIDIAVPANRVCGRMDGPTKAPGVDVNTVLDAPRYQWPRIVDARREDEWENDHLEGIEHVPLDELETVAEGWPRDEPIYFLCRLGNRSEQAALKLKGLGFRAAVNLEGGMVRVREKFRPGEV